MQPVRRIAVERVSRQAFRGHRLYHRRVKRAFPFDHDGTRPKLCRVPQTANSDLVSNTNGRSSASMLSNRGLHLRVVPSDSPFVVVIDQYLGIREGALEP